MARSARIARDDIVAAAVELVRDEGHERLSVRALAERLGCSTQPILYQFPSMADVRREAYRAADELHTAAITDGIERDDNPLLALGRNYVRFAHEQPRLFRFLFQSGEFDGRGLMALVADPQASPLVGLVRQATGLCEQDARSVFLAIFVAAHGLASLLANNAMPYDERLVEQVLEASFVGAFSQRGGGGGAIG